MDTKPTLSELAAQLRIDSLRCSTQAGSGHPTSSLSAADLVAVLVARHLRWNLQRPDDPSNDHLVFSKGHASPLLYAVLKAVGLLSDEELLRYRSFGSPLEGHPTPRVPFVDVATGSLGQGLPIGVGLALAARLARRPSRVWVLLGDSEMSEGSVWEAFDHARHDRLGRLIGILDMNRLGQSGPTPLGWDAEAYLARARAFGWRAIAVDGHDLDAIEAAYAEVEHAAEMPTLIVAKTVKGKGVAELEDADGWHGKALDPIRCEAAVRALGGQRGWTVVPRAPESCDAALDPVAVLSPAPVAPTYEVGARVATRQAYGDALVAVGRARQDIVVLDAEVKNSTCADAFAHALPDRYFEMFISEQQLVAAAVGMSARRWIPFASTFAAFLTRAFDFVRMAAVSRADLRLCGSHAGVSIGPDGPSQMGLEDLAMMRAVHGSTVLVPCCANQAAKLVTAIVDRDGIVYLRTTREKLPVLYDTGETFSIGGSRVLRRGPKDVVTVIAAGITVHEALEAHRALERRGVSIRVVDAYSVKPIDAAQVRACVRATGSRVVIVEDHRPEGGLGEAALGCLAYEDGPLRVVHLAVRAMPGSGTPDELLHAAGIDADAIERAVARLLAGRDEPAKSTRCYLCGEPGAWRIAVAGEDDPATDEIACEIHARGHVRRGRVAHAPPELRRS